MMKLALRIAFLTTVVALLTCGKSEKPYNVMIVAVDTLRPDHLSCYGYSRATSPNLDMLARQSVRCQYALSQAPWTLPSFSTVFTSLYPSQHGAIDVNSRMRTSFPTLASILKSKGYATGAIVNAPALKPAYRTSRGFDFYDMTPQTGRIADGTTRDALKWIDSVRDRPFFIFVHYFDPHLPYSPPPPYDTLYDSAYTGRIGRSFNLEGFSLVRDSMFVQMKRLSDADWKHIVALYDGEIAFTDSCIGVLLRGLEERHLRSNTLIVFLSDHGEEFFEHGGFEHGHTLYDDLLWVPLMFSMPGVLPEGKVVKDQVRLLDVAPTILDLIGIEKPPHFEGVSLAPLLTGRGAIDERSNSILPPGVSYAEAMRHGAEQKSITAYPWKLIYKTLNGEIEVFDLKQDPDEMVNLAGMNPPEKQRLLDYLYSTLFTVSDTWYVELGSRGHRFDIEIRAERGLSPGRIWLSRLLQDGKPVDLDLYLASDPLSSSLKLENLVTADTLLLAFKVKPWKMPLIFDLKIDGNDASAHTYLGASLASPSAMPFMQKPAKPRVLSDGRPQGEIDPPYCLIWYDRTPYTEETYFKLDEETKRQLRSLGYIQ